MELLANMRLMAAESGFAETNPNAAMIIGGAVVLAIVGLIVWWAHR